MGTTRLYSAASVEEQWSELAGAWLREQAVSAWRNPKPTVILTPGRAESFYLRSRLVEEGVSCLGLRFWTPSDARKFLLAETSLGLAPATLAEERLVVRTCAEKLAAQTRSDNATLTSVIREPNAFLRAYDLLLGAGWDPVRDGAEYGRKLAREVQRTLEKSNIATQAGLHVHLRKTASIAGEPLLANLLVIGFNAAHWPLWDLLQAIVSFAEEGVVSLLNPRSFAEKIDQLWIDSWQEITQTETLSPPGPMSLDAIPAPFADLVAAYEKADSVARTDEPSQAALTFLVTPDLSSQIRAIVLQTLEFLKHDSCTRLGIAFPDANALALGVADELRRLGIPLDDGTGTLVPGLFEQRCWLDWISLQEEPGVLALTTWLRACESQGVSSGIDESLKVREVANVLDKALSDSLVDDLNYLALYLEENSKGSRAGLVADFLHRRVALPQEATFSHFLELTRQALTLPGWENYLARFHMDPPAWLTRNSETVSRRIFLEWLRESTESQTRIRGADGNHFYSKVHLLIYAQMTGQTWSHLILTGLNEGVWPRLYEDGAFGSRHELVQLNHQARALNLRSTRQGGQGSGHEPVLPDHGHCLLPLERRDLALRDLCAALESTSDAACLAAMTTEAGRSLLPSDFYHHAYQFQTSRVLDEETFRNLADVTEAWCKKHQFLFAIDTPVPTSSITDTQVAHRARRDPAQPFGPYEFAYAQPPSRPIQLSCKRWEDAWNHPAIVWLEHVVGALSWPEASLGWSRTIGTWVHRWLADAVHAWQILKSAPAEFPVLVWSSADRDAQAVRRRAQEAAFQLYPWWDQVWAQARAVALSLSETLAPQLTGRQILSEFQLPRDLLIALPGTDQADFSLNGRIDLLLIESDLMPPDLAKGDLLGSSCWVVDFKTGSAPSLNAKKITEGQGIQTVLYALAAQALGATSVALSLHTAETPLKQQLQLNDVVEHTSLFRSLDQLHRNGVFGMRPDADNAYGYSASYPMATRFIAGDILEAKWALIHGDASVSSGEGE